MRSKSATLLLTALLAASAAHAAELTGRASILGTAGHDLHNKSSNEKSQLANQQSLRLMLDDVDENSEWSAHLKLARLHTNGYAATSNHASSLFRYRKLAGDWHNEQKENGSNTISYEIDRAAYKHNFGAASVSLGRQPIDWGSGRFWQPLNVFGAFTPTDLDTDFKPGIDVATVDWFPTAFSSLTAVYALSPKGDAQTDNSAALHYRRQIGARSELAVLAGQINGNDVIGASFESELFGIGWRFECARHKRYAQAGHDLFWIAGADYQFDDGTLVILEWHRDERGTNAEARLADIQTSQAFTDGLQMQSSRDVLGFSIEKDLTPLLHAGYKLLISPLKDTNDHTAYSSLHQLNFIYSMSNESDLLFSLLYATGKGVNNADDAQSEYGHLPASATIRYRHYF